MKTWVTRIFGMLNLIFTAGGFLYFANLISWNLHRWPGDVTKPEWSAFIVVTMLSITMLGTLGYAGVRLLRKDEAGIRLTALVCSVEILCIYMVAVSPL